VNKAPETNPFVKMEIIDDILYATYLPGVVINIDAAKEIIKHRSEYTKNLPYPSIVTGEGLRAINKDARAYFAKEGADGIVAAALLVKSVYTEFFGNMFLRITQTSIPSRLFRDKEEALKWLEQFKSKS
jgi:hypothetical protein